MELTKCTPEKINPVIFHIREDSSIVNDVLSVQWRLPILLIIKQCKSYFTKEFFPSVTEDNKLDINHRLTITFPEIVISVDRK